MTRAPRIPTPQLEERARLMTRDALTGWRIPDEMHERLTLGMYPRSDSDEVVFELYVAGDQPGSALVLTSVTLSRVTGDGSVVVNYDHLTRAGDDPKDRSLPGEERN